mmetsp:Transcript_41691/g.116161  ORF Transcript_41691/g.116161 Transcript_41691/m.116161 type:complete len:321 (-) Transcript_41691:220-1182(-)
MAGAPPTPGRNPLAVSYPSPVMLLQYPLLATNVRLLCEQDGWRVRKQSSSLATTFLALRLTYQTEGLAGLYRGADLYLLHQIARDALRLLADRCLRGQEGLGGGSSGAAAPEGSDGSKGTASAAIQQSGGEPQEGGPFTYGGIHRWLRLAAKYFIDAVCYPLLLASTRAVLLHDDARSIWRQLCLWSEAEGVLSLFGGLASSLASTALDEAADVLLDACIERCAAGSELGSVDRLMLKACSSSVASVLTAPFNYVGVIQRCQSRLPGLPSPSPLWGTVRSLPWMSSLYQLVMFGGILALNVKMIQLKLQLEDDPDEYADE